MKLLKQFNFETMTSLNQDEWNIEVGEKWANNELQHYTDHANNLFFDQGLVIRATYDNGVYRSARINTKDKFSFQYGKIEIVAKVPSGRGTWPALWMMSQGTPYGGWPRSGEIDIMEHTGNEKNKVYCCLHTEAYNHRLQEQYFKTHEEDHVADHFRTYGLLWEEDRISYYLDGLHIITYQKGQDGKDSTHKGWPFDHPFYLIINMAVGGSLGGDVVSSDFPQEFVIKSIKIWQNI